MDLLFEIFLFFLFFLSAALLLCLHAKRKKHVGTYSAVIFSCFFYFLLIPIILRFSRNTNLSSKYVLNIVNADLVELIHAMLTIALFVACFHVIYSLYNGKTAQLHYGFSESKLTNICKIVVWITFVVGGSSFLLYISAIGGLNRLLQLADYLRSFHTSATEFMSYQESLLIVPSRLITVTPIVCIVLVKRTQRLSLVYLFVFLTSFLLAAIYHLSNAGKTGLLLFALCFTVPLLYKFFKHPWLIGLFIAFACLPLLGVLDSLFHYLRTGDWRTVSTELSAYWVQFSYPFSNILKRNEILEVSGFRWGADYFTALLNILPGVSFDPSTVPTSLYYGGLFWKTRGGTPNDIITFGYLQLGYLGVAFSGTLLGFACGKIDRILSQIGSRFSSNVIRVALLTSFFAVIVNADPTAVIMNQIPLWCIALCVLYATTRVKSLH